MSNEAVFMLFGLALLLGFKHGMDADHLAAIDGLTRFNSAAGRTLLARACGFLFSLGHGVVVCVVAVSAGLLFERAMIPGWMDLVGVWVSALFLLMLAALNLHAVFSTPSNEMVQLVGLRSRLLGRLTRAHRPASVALVGALFALSFDTLSQAALFSASSARLGSAGALLLALCFMSGMMLTDAVNGLWISHLLRRADSTARRASRIMGVSVALVSLLVAALGLLSHFSPEAAAWSRGREMVLGFAVILVVAASFLLAKRAESALS